MPCLSVTVNLKRMELMSPMGFSLKTLVFASVCLLACFNLGLSHECSGVTCGHGTKSRCDSVGNCICRKNVNFTYRHQELVFCQEVQYCLRKCNNGNTCPENYVCKPDAPFKGRCVCADGYRRSVNGECVGLSLKCKEVECGYGTESSCNNDGSCKCSNQFSNRHKVFLFGQDVQYCRQRCDDDNLCPTNYVCIEQKCVCGVGYRRSGNGECLDINECLDKIKCVKLPGPRKCNCPEGYNRSDNDECIKDNDECLSKIKCDDKPNMRCINTPGSFRCDCIKGYKILTNNNQCEDNDECLGRTKCDNKLNMRCINTLGSFKCECMQGYKRLTNNNECEDECLFNDNICKDKNNTVCVNSQGYLKCECLPGYSSDNSTSCQDIDECVKKPCGEHSVCKNVPGNYSCRCQEGYTLTMDANYTCFKNERAAARVTDGNGGSSVGLYVGVTVGVLVLLGLIVAAIFVRRRRNSKKSSEGVPQFSSREPERKQNSSNGYDNISLDNEDVDLSTVTETRKEKTVSVEYSNGKIPLNKLARNSSSISVEYSNNKILASTERNEKKPVSSKPTQHPTVGDGGLEDQGGYGKEGILPHNNRPEMMAKSPNPGITAKFDDTEAYNTLDAFRLSTKNKSPAQHEIAGVTSQSESQGVYSSPYDEHVLPNNNKNKENLAAFPDPVTGDTVDDSDAYNTLDAFNLSTQNKPKTDTRMEDLDHYNIVL